PEDCRSLCRHGNQHVRLRDAQVVIVDFWFSKGRHSRPLLFEGYSARRSPAVPAPITTEGVMPNFGTIPPGSAQQEAAYQRGYLTGVRSAIDALDTRLSADDRVQLSRWIADIRKWQASS